jgi:hypothetical protein
LNASLEISLVLSGELVDVGNRRVITSTILTLLVIPTVCEILAETRDWLGANLSRRTPRSGYAAHESSA